MSLFQADIRRVLGIVLGSDDGLAVVHVQDVNVLRYRCPATTSRLLRLLALGQEVNTVTALQCRR
jgi:hypothetical protein